MRLLIAGGGTGGHIFPAIAVAEEFLQRDPNNHVLFIGTRRGMESKIIPQLGYKMELIRSRGIVVMSLADRVKGIITVPISLMQSLKIMWKFKPQFALGVGGYVSGPALIASWILRVPRAIHEQNTFPGITNRILSSFSHRVFISFDEARSYFKKADKKQKIIMTGNPTRKKILERLTSGQKDKKENNQFCILIVGGSQGAQTINILMTEALPYLEKYRHLLKIIHQTGEKGQYDVALKYAKRGFRAKVQNFIDNMEQYLADCDLIVSRAGAGAIAEIALGGKPSILIPFPHAAGDHQTKNAQLLVKEKAALLFQEKELTGEKLAKGIEKLINNTEIIREMSQKAKAVARPKAAADIVDEIYAIAKTGKKGKLKKD